MYGLRPWAQPHATFVRTCMGLPSYTSESSCMSCCTRCQARARAAGMLAELARTPFLITLLKHYSCHGTPICSTLISCKMRDCFTHVRSSMILHRACNGALRARVLHACVVKHYLPAVLISVRTTYVPLPRLFCFPVVSLSMLHGLKSYVDDAVIAFLPVRAPLNHVLLHTMAMKQQPHARA